MSYAESRSILPRVIPLWAKIGYSAFMCVLVPFYLATYGPTNFFYFCDVALFFTLAAIWTEKPLLAGIPASGWYVAGLLLTATLALSSWFNARNGHPWLPASWARWPSSVPPAPPH